MEAGYYPALSGTTRYYRQGNLWAISGISSDLQLSVVFVRLPYFNTLSIYNRTLALGVWVS
eukprot:649128-Amorphochlora_amoeboformis.AAC.1